MTQEQKAKAYDEALDRAKKLQKTCDSQTVVGWCEYIFPVLKKSEDEKTRKEIVGYLKKNLRLEWATWLEKQGKQETTTEMITPEESLGIDSETYNKIVDECIYGEQKPILDIEIPFGAKDSELQEATYLIPEGFHAEIKGDEVLIKKGKQKPAELHTDEQNLNACLGYIPDEFLRRWLTNIIHVKYEPKFKVGNIISDGNVVYRVDNIVKNAIGQDCYFLVNIRKEKNGTRYIKLYYSDGSFCYDGETTWLCEQVDRKF